MILSRAQLTLTTIPEVVGVTRYYMLRDQSLPTPVVPTTNPPSETGWVTTEPAYTEGSTNNLYTVDLLLYSDDSFQYSLVSLSSAYAASKQAYILAKENEKHFFFDTDGAHITHGEHTPNTGKNVLITNEGMAIRNDTTNLASFGAELLRMGPEESARVDIQPNATTFYGSTGAQVGKIANNILYYSVSGESIFEEGGDRESVISDYSNTTQTHTLAYTPAKNPNVSDPMLRVQFILENEGGAVYNQSVNFDEAGNSSFQTLPATVTYSGRSVSITLGNLSTVIASSWEGAFIILRAYYYRSEDTSNYSLGMSSSATGKFAYAGGYGTTAAADYSHAHGRGLYTANSDITVVGRYNRYADAYEDSTLFAVGNGSSASSRSDAFQIHSDGIAWTSRGSLLTNDDVFKTGKSIGANTSLYNVTSPGYYYVASAAIAGTLSGSPPFTNQPFNMLVLTGNNSIVMQIAWGNIPAGRIKYRIRNSSGTWNGVWTISTQPTDIRDYIYDLSHNFGSFNGLTVSELASGASLNAISTDTGIHVAASYGIGDSLVNGPQGYKAGRYEVKRSLSTNSNYFITELTPCTFPSQPKRARYYYSTGSQYGNWHAVSGGEASFTVNATNFSVERSLLCRNGNIISVQLVLAAAKSLPAGTAVTVGTLNPRPGLKVGVWAKSGTAQMQNAYLYDQTSNNLLMNPTVALASGASVEMNFTYGSEY